MKKNRLWDKNFTLITVATTMGSVGAIAGEFALSFFIFDETGSTFAAALVIAIQIIPGLMVPVTIAPLMDRLPRKAFLVGGDLCNGILYGLMGYYLIHFDFSYLGYLFISLILGCLGAIDELAYSSIYPSLIKKGEEEKGYAISSMIYPVLKVVMMPIAAILLDTLGVAFILMIQGGLSLMGAFTESVITLEEDRIENKERYGFKQWKKDILEAVEYLKKEKGLRSIYEYMAITNGVARGYGPLLIGFFRTTPGFTATMYAFFSLAEFVGRMVGSSVQYVIKVPKKKKYYVTFLIYQIYETMDMCLLWIPYPFMLLNRGLCGFLGNNSAVLRTSAVQKYLPEKLRARINALERGMITVFSGSLALVVGGIGELVDYRWAVTLCGAGAALSCWLILWRNRKAVNEIYIS